MLICAVGPECMKKKGTNNSMKCYLRTVNLGDAVYSHFISLTFGELIMSSG